MRDFPRDDHSATAMRWDLPDPSAAADGNRASYRQFRRLATELDTRIGFLLPVLHTMPMPRREIIAIASTQRASVATC